ncbi:MAG: YIP1 family protein [Limnochordia bacterium]|nr:MAG: hypothetical protein AA931_06025 [Peptococcaceae bacterium 1109]
MRRGALLLILILAVCCVSAHAIESTTYTYTTSIDGRFIRTHDAYVPGSVLLRELGLRSPEDIFLQGQEMYIADTGNRRIVRYRMDTGAVEFLGEGLLRQPTGVCVAHDGRIFVADYGASAVVVLSNSGDAVLSTITKPETVLYGAATPYKPQKVAVDSFGNLYVTSEGTHEGILQFDVHGKFAGFFGANKADALSLMEWIQERLFTAEQKARLMLRNPPRIVNLEVPEDNLIYTVTQFRPRQSLKKLNMAGVNILGLGWIFGENNYVDMAVGPGGELFAVTNTGAIAEYDQDGRYLFAFGGRATASDRNGLTSVVSAIAVDRDYTLFVLDKQRGIVQPYVPTEFASSIHQGLAHYAAGRYGDAADIWRDFMRLTPQAAFAHWGYGLAMWQLGEFAQAKYHLELVGDWEYASDAFWELRNAWLMENLGTVLVILIALAVLLRILRAFRKGYSFLKPLEDGWERLKGHSTLLRDVLYVRHMLRHPIDAVYDLRHHLRGSVLSATILYLLALGVWLADSIFTARLFNANAFAYTWQNPLIVTSLVMIPTALFVVGNYFISSINDGEGTFVNVYTVTAYALSAYILATPWITLLSHGLTLNEAFLHALARAVVGGYTFVLVFIAIKEVHGYTVGDTIKNLALTACFMVLAVLAMAILYLMWNQLVRFVVTLIEEVRYLV